MNDKTYSSSVQGMEILQKQFLDTVRVTGDRILSHYKKIEAGGDNLVAQSMIQAKSISGLWASALASISTFASGGATALADLFTDRDELLAYTEALKHLVEGSSAYVRIQAEINKITGEASTADIKNLSVTEMNDELSALGKNIVSLTRDLGFRSVIDTDGITDLTGKLNIAKTRAVALANKLEELTDIGGTGKRPEFVIGFDEATLLKIEKKINDIKNVEASAFEARANGIRLLEIESKKLDEKESASEKNKQYAELVLMSLDVESKYTKDLLAEDKKRVSEAAKLAKAKESAFKAAERARISLEKLQATNRELRAVLSGEAMTRLSILRTLEATRQATLDSSKAAAGSAEYVKLENELLKVQVNIKKESARQVTDLNKLNQEVSNARFALIDEVAIRETLILENNRKLLKTKQALLIKEAQIELIQSRAAAITDTHTQESKTLEIQNAEEKVTLLQQQSGLIDEATEKSLFGYTAAGQAIKGLSDGMTAGFTTFFDRSSEGFMDMGDLAGGILDSIINQLMQAMVIAPLVQGITTGVTAFAMTYAQGDTFTNSPSLSAHSNSVVDTATPFMFAQGAGVFGEAGPEAIMPLTRTSSGDLGVQMVGSKNSTPNVYINIENNSGQEIEQESSTSFNGKDFVVNTVISAITRNTGGTRDIIRGIK